MTDDVSLYLGGAGFDCVAARSQIGVSPLTVIDSVVALAFELSVRPEHFHRDLLHSLIHFAPEDFLYRSFGTRNSGLAHSGQRAHLIEPEDFDLGINLCELLSN